MIRKIPQLGSVSILQNTDRQVKYAMQVLVWQVSKKNNSDYYSWIYFLLQQSWNYFLLHQLVRIWKNVVCRYSCSLDFCLLFAWVKWESSMLSSSSCLMNTFCLARGQQISVAITSLGDFHFEYLWLMLNVLFSKFIVMKKRPWISWPI